jgi:alpha-methylacyl-CoA racemase
VLIEGFRPGVAERLGVGPGDCLAGNPALVYGRMTGWGQHGPWAKRAGHDINYIGLTGVLDAIGPAGGRPTVPLNVVGDFGGGGMLLAVGVLAAVLHARRSGAGQVVDAAIVDGTALLGTMFHGLLADGALRPRRASNTLDGGAPFYDTYECRDGRYVAVGALEPAFYAQLVAGLELDASELPDRKDPAQWGALRARFAAVFAQRDRDEWAESFGDDACVTPVLSFAEAPAQPHNVSRSAYVDVGGVVQPVPAPRFSATRSAPSTRLPRPGEDSRSALSDWGFSPDEIAELEYNGTVAQAGTT